MIFKNEIEYNKYSLDDLMSLSGREFSDAMCEILKLALIRDASFYEWMILNFNEIMDRENDALMQVVSKVDFIMNFFCTKDPEKQNEAKLLRFGELVGVSLFTYFEDKFTYGECLALGLICSSNVAYKRNMLSKEEYYEIRDMFVPFGLPISLDKFDVDKVISIMENHSLFDEMINDFVLLKKIGKAVTVKNVTVEEIRTCVNELIVEWD